MSPERQIELLKMAWTTGAIRSLTTLEGAEVAILRVGEYDPAKGRYMNAEIDMGGEKRRGEIVFSAAEGDRRRTPGDDRYPIQNNRTHYAADYDKGYNAGGDKSYSGDNGGDSEKHEIPEYESCILQVVPSVTAQLFDREGNPIPQALAEIDPVVIETYNQLRDGAGNYGCAGHIARMDDLRRVNLFTRLLTDRLARKCNDLNRIHTECEENWNETMYVMLMRSMGDSRNKEAFTELARKVKYTALSRERNSIVYVESLLLGTSGLLEIYPDDTYIRDLKGAYEYLRVKYSITPMLAGEWSIPRNNPHNHPVLRIAQVAAFLTQREFLFDNMRKCRTVEDVQTFFRAEASQYWSTHFVPGSRSDERPKRIGHFKANVMGINLTVPMIFAYGDYTGDEELKQTAVELLEKMNCEENRIVDSWRERGVVMESAFDSQAILQLNNEFCLKGLCWRCPVGKYVIGGVAGHSRG